MIENLWHLYQTEEVIKDLIELFDWHAQAYRIRISWNYFQILVSLSWDVSIKKLPWLCCSGFLICFSVKLGK